MGLLFMGKFSFLRLVPGLLFGSRFEGPIAGGQLRFSRHCRWPGTIDKERTGEKVLLTRAFRGINLVCYLPAPVSLPQ